MSEIKLSSQEASKLYYNMLLCRRFEEKCAQLYSMGKIAGFLHLYIGQEAIAAGLNFLKEPQDSHITSYRCHAHALLQGEISPESLMAELTGRSTGCSKGKGGSMHVYSVKNHFYGGNGIVGAQVPLGTGLAFAHKYKNDNGVSLTYMGDGALPQGQVYEAFNMASLWKLPIVYIIENNQYSMGTPLNRTHANTDLVAKGSPWLIPGEKVDGMDILNVIDAGKKAIDYARSGKGPYLLEFVTYRFRGHSMSDPQKYRTKEEVTEMREHHDPIKKFEKYSLENNLLNETDIKNMGSEIKDLIKKVEEYSLNSPEPEISQLYTDITA